MAGGPAGQAAAPGHHQVRAGDQLGGQRSGETTTDPEVVRLVRERPGRDGGRGQQRTDPVGQGGDLPSVRQRPAPRQEHRTFGVAEQLRHETSAASGFRRCPGGRGQGLERGSLRWSTSAAWTSSGRLSTTVRRPCDGRPIGPDDVIDRRTRAVHPLGNGADAADQRVLVDAEVRSDGGTGDVGRQHHQRRPALRRLGDAGHRVGQSAALVHAQHGDPADWSGRTRRPSSRHRPRVGRRRTAPRRRPARWSRRSCRCRPRRTRGRHRGRRPPARPARPPAPGPSAPSGPFDEGEDAGGAARPPDQPQRLHEQQGSGRRQPVELLQLRQTQLAGSQQEVVRRKGRIHPTGRTRIDADGLDPVAADRPLVGQPAGGLDRRTRGVRAVLRRRSGTSSGRRRALTSRSAAAPRRCQGCGRSRPPRPADDAAPAGSPGRRRPRP